MDTQPTPGNEVQFEIDPLGEPVITLGIIRMVTSEESRVITDHQVGDLNKAITITAAGMPTVGGMFSQYTLSLETGSREVGAHMTTIVFQNQPLADGYNGFTIEAYLAVLMHRLRCAQNGKFACEHNDKALFHLTQAMNQLKLRMLEREERGVLGTHKV